MIEVTDDDIAFAKSILLEEGHDFDPDRQAFIKDFSTLDLHAVPGSGKTTALLAKLVILETKLPLPNGVGVLVLSHTNVAVDEIYERIGKHCPKLFRYPNFVGTIQSFVDHFLAVPFYCQHFGHKPIRIDDEIYNEYIQNYKLPQGAGNWVNRKNDPNKFLKQLRFDSETNLISKIDGTKERFDLKDPTSPTYKALKGMKIKTMKKGILCYDDAYFLSSVYRGTVLEINSSLRNRFPFVFVDEMQDMDVHQHNLLEELFFHDEVDYQRIGDRNQAIYSGSPKLDKVWSDRANIKRISGSHRLSEKNASVVEYFALERGNDYELNGLRSGDIKPHIILYDDSSKERVIERFGELIEEFVNSGDIEINDKSRFKAVGWVRSTDSDNKVNIGHYAPEFNPYPSNKRLDYDSLTEYLMSVDQSTEALRDVQNVLIRSILKVLRLELVEDESGRWLTKTKLMASLKQSNWTAYTEFRSKLYSWSIQLIANKSSEVKEDIIEYIPELLALFDTTVSQCADFLNAGHGDINRESSEVIENTIVANGRLIEIGTIHSVKGQTTTAILYLETYFQSDGGKSYESERLSAQFKSNYLRTNAGIRVKQSAKMAYVGLSRPTDLMCIAIHNDRFDQYLLDIDQDKWEVIDLTIRHKT